MERSALTRYAWLSIAAAIATIGLKASAYLITGSVGLLSDALESLVNLVAAIMALAMLTIAARPPDAEHAYGHEKAEYFSSGFEGALIMVAAGTIMLSAIPRLINPQPIEQVGLGLAVSVVASLVNFGVVRVLKQAGRRYNSITLEAVSAHLMTDVWTSVGVLVGVGLVARIGWERLDPIVALAVAVNIIWSCLHLLRRSARGLMDTARQRISEMQCLRSRSAIRPRVSSSMRCARARPGRAFISMHVLVPGEWTVRQSHALLEWSRPTCARHCRAQRSSRIWSRSATRCPGMIRSYAGLVQLDRHPPIQVDQRPAVRRSDAATLLL